MLHSLLALFMAAAGAIDEAPAETLDPAATIQHLLDAFGNHHISADEIVDESPATGPRFRFHLERKFESYLCDDVAVVRVAMTLGYVGRPKNDQSYDHKCMEQRWALGSPYIKVELACDRVPKWPNAEIPFSRSQIASIVRMDASSFPRSLERELTFQIAGMIESLVGQEHQSGLTLADMAKDGGPGGFRLRRVEWVSRNRDAIRYEFKSPDRGTTSVTFNRIGGAWYATVINLDLQAEDKVAPDERVTPEQRQQGIGRVRRVTRRDDEFPAPYTGLDRLERTYEIHYDEKPASEPRLPKSIVRKETAWLRGLQSVVETRLVFHTFRTGTITCDEVRNAMLPLPDGMETFSVGEKTAWTTRGGEVVPKVDSQALDVGRLARFTPGSGGGIAIWLGVGAVAVVVGGVALWRRGIRRT